MVLSSLVKKVMAVIALAVTVGAGVAGAQEPRTLVPTLAPGAPGAGFYADSWAVIIGINDYQHARVPKLRYAVNDAQAVEQALLAQGFRRDRIVALVDAQATKSRIERLLGDELRRKVGPNDRVLVFFAGHGMTDRLRSGEEEGYLIPVDGDPGSLFGTAISMTALRQISDRVPAKHILYVVDACYSGYALFNRSIGTDLLEEMLKKPAIQILTAGRQGDQAQERAGHGVFTEVLIRGLQGDAFGDKGWLALEELGVWMKQRVFAESNRKQLPQFGNLSGEGQFVFVKPGARVAVAPPPPEPRRPPVASLRVTHTIPVGLSPQRAVITPRGDHVYVSNRGSHTVSVIGTATGAVVQTLSVGREPDALAVSPDGSKVYVGQHGGNVSVIDTATRAVATLAAGSPIRDLALTPDGRALYLAMEFSGLKKLDVSARAVSNVSDTACPQAVVLTPDGGRGYVNYQCAPSPGIGGHDPVRVFNVATGTFLPPIASLPDGKRMRNVGSALAITPNGAQVWANGADACRYAAANSTRCPTPASGILNVIRSSDNTVIRTLFGSFGRVTFSADSSRAFVGGPALQVFDTATFNLVDTLAIPASGSIALTPAGSRGFVPLPEQGLVAVLEIPPRR